MRSITSSHNFATYIVVISSVWAIASPLPIYSLSSGTRLSTIETVSLAASDIPPFDSDKIVELERRDEPPSIATGILIMKSSAQSSSSEWLYKLVLDGQISFFKQGKIVKYEALPRKDIHNVKDLDIRVKIQVPKKPKTLETLSNQDRATLLKIARVDIQETTEEDCRWIMSALHDLAGSLTEEEKKKVRDWITSKEKEKNITPTCDGVRVDPPKALIAPSHNVPISFQPPGSLNYPKELSFE